MLASPLRTPLIRTGKFGIRAKVRRPDGTWTDPSHRAPDRMRPFRTP